MASNVSNTVSIESYVGNLLENVANDATNDLRAMGTKVQTNMAEKQAIRDAQKALAAVKLAVTNAGTWPAGANSDWWKIQSSLQAAGVPAGDPIYKMFQPYSESNPTGYPNFADKEKTEAYFKAMESALDGQAQSRSDLGQQLQLALQESNNIYTRATKAQSDVSAKYNQRDDGIAQNFK